MVQRHQHVDHLAVRGLPGIRYLELFVSCDPLLIGQFYSETFGCLCTSQDDGQRVAVQLGASHFVFTKAELTEEQAAAGQGIHVCVYVAMFEQKYQQLKRADLIWTNPRFLHLDTCDTLEEAKASRQFRFKDIVDLETGSKLLELEHETRASRHYQFMKHVSYNPM